MIMTKKKLIIAGVASLLVAKVPYDIITSWYPSTKYRCSTSVKLTSSVSMSGEYVYAEWDEAQEFSSGKVYIVQYPHRIASYNGYDNALIGYGRMGYNDDGNSIEIEQGVMAELKADYDNGIFDYNITFDGDNTEIHSFTTYQPKPKGGENEYYFRPYATTGNGYCSSVEWQADFYIFGQRFVLSPHKLVGKPRGDFIVLWD